MENIHGRMRAEIQKTLKHGSNFEIVGRTVDPKLAEAMAYTAKPLIDLALEDLKNPDNSDTMAEVTLPNGQSVLTDIPGVRLPNGRVESFNSIHVTVDRAQQAASGVEVKYYNRIKDAKAAVLVAQDKLGEAQNTYE